MWRSIAKYEDLDQGNRMKHFKPLQILSGTAYQTIIRMNTTFFVLEDIDAVGLIMAEEKLDAKFQ